MTDAERKQRRKETQRKYHKSEKYARYMCDYWLREYERRKNERENKAESQPAREV